MHGLGEQRCSQKLTVPWHPRPCEFRTHHGANLVGFVLLLAPTTECEVENLSGWRQRWQVQKLHGLTLNRRNLRNFTPRSRPPRFRVKKKAEPTRGFGSVCHRVALGHSCLTSLNSPTSQQVHPVGPLCG